MDNSLVHIVKGNTIIFVLNLTNVVPYQNSHAEYTLFYDTEWIKMHKHKENILYIWLRTLINDKRVYKLQF
jgi:hypothetical protein